MLLRTNTISALFQKPMSKIITFSLLWLLLNILFLKDSYALLSNIQAKYYELYGLSGFFLGLVYTIFFLFPFSVFKLVSNMLMAATPLARMPAIPEGAVKSLLLGVLLAFQVYFAAIVLYILVTKYIIGTSFFFPMDEITDFKRMHADVKVVSSMIFGVVRLIPHAFASVTTDFFAFVIHVFQVAPLISLLVFPSITYYSFQRRQDYHGNSSVKN
jgi:hypothetical protein